ncbi:stress response serine/threonine protein kinase YihE [Saccharospirillum sp. MSK14-1]|uniref:serine/threonine protein kinase n=1 Tax=Saccharospirillum sp. MSK14-1 TaxID=1897632 RepID=UPI000D36E98A|nr:serine/threonine protein kinase [Saccharospirillum sp. MSK14-1]PTY37899.1 stress response serine/threonine protein kinase YihE [Saccharospirillum sp. MSK14-1]
MTTSAHPYDALSQDRLIDWIESLGLWSDYRLYPLNSYENRVYRVGIEDAEPMVVKVYRPGRWNEAQIREELQFTDQLAVADVPVVPALNIAGDVLHERDGFYFACFPMRAGHAFELDNPDQLYRIGQHLGRLHNVGVVEAFEHRPRLSLLDPLQQAQTFFADSPLLPDDLRANYLATLEPLIRLIQDRFEPIYRDIPVHRIHGDFHAGNILSRGDQLLIVDLDDTVMGPAAQDIWKLLSGDVNEQRLQLSELEEGYEQFRPFPKSDLALLEPLRTVHMVRHTLWIAQRWQDPAFPRAFSWFDSARFWSDHLLALREQWSLLQEA